MKPGEIEDIIFHLGEEEFPYGAILPPVFHSVNYGDKDPEALAERLAHELERPLYTRGNNPTVALLRRKLAALEGAEDSLVFSSGSAAMAATVMSYVHAGDHVLCVQEAYSWTTRLLRDFLSRYGVTYSFADGCEASAFLKGIQSHTRLVILESPTSLFFNIQDIQYITTRCRELGIPVVVDNSCCTPLGQRPLSLGADAVVHSLTKYPNGHGDVVAGVVCGSKDRIQNIFYGPYMTLGAVCSAEDAWKILRGLRTFPLRFKKSCETLQVLLDALVGHPMVQSIRHPWYGPPETQALARRQMSYPGGLFALEFCAQDPARLKDAFRRLRRFKLAVSWGGFESLALPYCVFPPQAGLPANMARFYCGLDEPTALLEDLLNLLKYLE